MISIRRAPLVAILVLCGCSRAGEPRRRATRPNVVVVTVDTLRADRLGCYGFELARTPHIDRLAAQGVRVDHAIAPAPLTLPSHTSIFTGLEPPAHGVRDNGAFIVPDGVQTLAERLKAAGYQTQAFVSAEVLHRRYNLNQGFDGYDDQLWNEDDPSAFLLRERSGRRTMDRVLQWLDAHVIPSQERAPFFLWVHLFDPHFPYNPPASDAKLAPTPYDGEIASVDRQIGRFVDAMEQKKALDDTILVFTSDHGESLGEHEESTHAIFIYESTVRVPLIFRYPRKLPAGKVYEASVRSVDLMPTILSLADQELNETQGVDLSKALAGTALPSSLPLYSESLHPELQLGMARLHGIRVDNWTYIRAPRAELYDRADDPSEVHNLLEPSAEDPGGAAPEAATIRAAKLDQALTKVLEDSRRFGIVSRANPLDQQTIAMLQALGYMGDPGARRGLEGMDPKDGVQFYAQLKDALQLVLDGDDRAAAKILTSVLERLPTHVLALNTLAQCELRMGNPKAAEQHYLKSLAAEPRQHEVLVELGRMRLAAGKHQSARARFLEALELVPASVEAMTLMGYLDLGVGRPEEAKRWYDKAIQEDPSYPEPYLGYAGLHVRAGNYQEAKRWYDKALEMKPQSFDGWLNAGLCALHLGDPSTAERYFLRAAQINPESWYPLYNLAVARALNGDSDSALQYLEKAADKGFSDPTLLLGDRNLVSLRQDPRLQQFIQTLGGRGSHNPTDDEM